jgi:hypothetical protein
VHCPRITKRARETKKNKQQRRQEEELSLLRAIEEAHPAETEANREK